MLTAALAVATVAAAYYRHQWEQRRLPEPVPLLTRVQLQLALPPVLAAEEALRARPHDPAARRRLADACERTGDPVGAALALLPLASGRGDGPTVARFIHDAVQVGWLTEAAAALDRLSTPPVRAALDLADALVTRGEAPRAVVLLAALEQRTANGMTADDWLNGAMTWYQCRRPARASEWARRAVSMTSATAGEGAPSATAARGVLARCLLAAGQPEAALLALTEVHGATAAGTAGAPGAGSFLDLWRARAALRWGDRARRHAARDALARLGMQEPPDPVAAFEAGRASLEGEAATAAVLLSRAAGAHYQEVLCDELLARAYQSLERPSMAAWARGHAMLARGDLGKAQSNLRRSLQLAPLSATASLDLAKALSLVGRPQESLAVLERAQAAHPSDPDLAFARADALNQLDRFTDQAQLLESMADRSPERAAAALRALGRMYHETRQFDLVVPVLERALQRGDADAEAHRLLGLTEALHAEEPARAARALSHLLRAAALDPANGVQWTAAGALLERLDHQSEAAACYRRGILGESGAEAPYVALARVLQRESRPAEAALLLKFYRERREVSRRRRQEENRIAIHRADATAHLAMGDLVLRHDSFRAAYPYLLIAASLRPHWQPAQARLADVCALLDYADMWQPVDPTSPLPATFPHRGAPSGR